MQEIIFNPQIWASLLTLTALEIVLGIDNIVFISILAGKLPPKQRHFAMRLGLIAALGSRLVLLVCLRWIMQLTTPLFTFLAHGVSGKDLILIGGGLFLVAKATWEIYDKVEAAHPATERHENAPKTSMVSVITQIMVLDLVFSLDSVITAVGMVSQLWIMIVAVVVAMIIMLIFAAPVGDFVERHPSIKILALAFLILIGVLLMAEGTGRHVEKGYVYFAMTFSLVIELLNIRYRARRDRLIAARSRLRRSGGSE